MTKQELQAFKAKHKLTLAQIGEICETSKSNICNWLYADAKIRTIYEKTLKEWEKKQ